MAGHARHLALARQDTHRTHRTDRRRTPDRKWTRGLIESGSTAAAARVSLRLRSEVPGRMRRRAPQEAPPPRRVSQALGLAAGPPRLTSEGRPTPPAGARPGEGAGTVKRRGGAPRSRIAGGALARFTSPSASGTVGPQASRTTPGPGPACAGRASSQAGATPRTPRPGPAPATCARPRRAACRVRPSPTSSLRRSRGVARPACGRPPQGGTTAGIPVARQGITLAGGPLRPAPCAGLGPSGVGARPRRGPARMRFAGAPGVASRSGVASAVPTRARA